jgi:hypothetical protein
MLDLCKNKFNMSLWVTYAWVDNEEGNFDYLIQELNGFGISTSYDRVAIVPGQRLWTQIAEHIADPNTSGWAYLITPNSLASQPCLEELSYAINRMLTTKGGLFPLIGLVTPGVSFDDVPIALKVRLCVMLNSPNWKQQVRAAIDRRPPVLLNNPQTRFIYNIIDGFTGVSSITTIEIRPRFNEVHNCRIAVPNDCNILNFGAGPAGTGSINGVQISTMNGLVGQLNGQEVKVVGFGGPITPGTSAYIILEGIRPRFVAFGSSNESFGNPTEMEIVQL